MTRARPGALASPRAMLAPSALAACLLLGGCELSGAAKPAAATDRFAGSYQLVLESRPDNVAEFVALPKLAYDQCAAKRVAQRLPVKPFVVLPADFVLARRTLVSDGTNFFDSHEQFGFGGPPATPENGCATAIVATSKTRLLRGEQYEQAEIGRDGKLSVSASARNTVKPHDQRAWLAKFSQPRAGSEVAMRCLPQDDPVIASRMAREMCIYGAPGQPTLTDIDGKAILLAQRLPSYKSAGANYAQQTTLRSISLGLAIPAQRFSLPIGRDALNNVAALQGANRAGN